MGLRCQKRPREDCLIVGGCWRFNTGCERELRDERAASHRIDPQRDEPTAPEAPPAASFEQLSLAMGRIGGTANMRETEMQAASLIAQSIVALAEAVHGLRSSVDDFIRVWDMDGVEFTPDNDES